MRSCTFLGHQVCPDDIRPLLYAQIENLIVGHNVTMSYVGNQGYFFSPVRSVLKEMGLKYPFINCAVVLAYLPNKRAESTDYSDSMLPEGIESYAIACGASKYVAKGAKST